MKAGLPPVSLALVLAMGFASPASAQRVVQPAAQAVPGDEPLLPMPNLRPSTSGVEGDAAEANADVPPSDVAYAAYQRGYYLTALELAEPLANLGDPAAQTLIGDIYERGLGVPEDIEEAARWYGAAAEAGSPEGQFRYGLMVLAGRGVARDPAKARDLMKAAADAGVPMAQFNYAQLVVEASPASGFEEAIPYFESAAAAGLADAQYALAQFYAYGQGIEKDETVARRWLQAAAKSGYDSARLEYGIWLLNGRGGPANVEEGFQLLMRAAVGGNPIAINRVSHLLKDGIGTEPDVKEAAKWAILAKRVENSDPELDDFFRGLDADSQKAALEAANRFRAR